MDANNIFYVKEIRKEDYVGTSRIEITLENGMLPGASSELPSPGTPVLLIPITGDSSLGREGVMLDLVKLIISDLQGIKDFIKKLDGQNYNRSGT